MEMFGLPQLLSKRRMQTFVLQTREQLDIARIEAVTGRAADPAKRLAGDVGRLQLVEKGVRDAERRLATLEIARTEFRLVDQTLDGLRGRAQSVSIEIEAALGIDNRAALDALSIRAESELEIAVSGLNASYGGRFLFAGASTGDKPILSADRIVEDVTAILRDGGSPEQVDAALDEYFDDALGDFRTAVYGGSTTDAPDRDLSETRRVGHGVRADDPAIRDVLRGFAVLAAVPSAPFPDNDAADSVRDLASRYLRRGGDGLVSVQSRNGALEAEIETAVVRTQASKSAYETTRGALVAVDQYEAASRMQALETQLEAIYLTTSRIAGLSLVNYLR